MQHVFLFELGTFIHYRERLRFAARVGISVSCIVWKSTVEAQTITSNKVKETDSATTHLENDTSFVFLTKMQRKYPTMAKSDFHVLNIRDS